MKSASTINPFHLARVEARLHALRATLAEVISPEADNISWEIGSGHGHFLTRYAALNPGRFFIGIDILSDRLRKAEKKRASLDLANLKFIKAEAGEFIACLPPAKRFAEVLILFPDPWPKKRHHKNRLIQTGFLDRLASRMTPSGRLYFRTDHEPYLQWTQEALLAHPLWEIVPRAPWVLEEKTVFQARADTYGSLVAEVRTPSSKGAPPG